MFLYYNKMVIHHKNLMLLNSEAEMKNSYYSSNNTLPKLTCRRQSST